MTTGRTTVARSHFEDLLLGDIKEIRCMVGDDYENDAAADELWARYRISFDEACMLAGDPPSELDHFRLHTAAVRPAQACAG
jgi:hypothetical protein